MERNRRIANWAGAITGIVLALVLNAALAHGSDRENAVTEEFHQTYPLAANGRIELSKANRLLTIVQRSSIEARRIAAAVDRDGVGLRRVR